MFQRILIANRGEIALRIMRACKDMGIQTVVVYSEADREAPYVQLADQALCIGPPQSINSYLKITHIIAAAEISNAQAIHPGYGFLAENDDFAEKCRSSGFEFIGPSHESMRMLGNKSRARELAMSADVPTVPGSPGAVDDEQTAMALAEGIGFPVLIKAAAGGGGKGMRIALSPDTFLAAWHQARTEAENAFNNSTVYLEKFIEQPRHIEVQVLADRHGNVVHLWERDCSVQRRYQKLIEESPAPGLPQETREKICAAAVRLLQAANYENACTCEFLVDKNFDFYFIEANTRIQVEHPVTELVTGVDLIQEQIRIAAGEPLRYKQEDIKLNGAAIECRVNAEDPSENFRPSPGRITRWIPPGGYGVRLDTHASQGYMVPPHYDSMIAKLLVHRNTRDEAIATMKRALGEFVIEGVSTTIPLHLHILEKSKFVEGGVDTKYLERFLDGTAT